jgi:hypothetical protein
VSARRTRTEVALAGLWIGKLPRNRPMRSRGAGRAVTGPSPGWRNPGREENHAKRNGVDHAGWFVRRGDRG